ncbi:alpha/beta fold hydrolase [Pseudoduganella eburnea]|uniref:Alpha/beta fold hydrolase n=1 Tax=Massilia eburnea TaxID=1776165 RepID=A0A6L6QLZ4_9BURK|nr:alpha/beta fold hydrolase [Massilia eburnea]
MLLALAGCKTVDIKESMIIRPDALTQARPLPQQAFENGTALEVARPDGAVLHGVLVTRNGAERTLLYFGGNAFHLDESGRHVVAALEGCKANVAIFDYRGYGRSSGMPTVANMKGDGVAIYDVLAARYPGNVIVHGQSLGSFVAAGVAQERPVRGLVLETTATNALDWANNSLPWYFKPFINFKVDDALAAIDNVQVAGSIKAPLLVLAGGEDKTTPAAMSQRVFEASPAEHKRIVILPGAGHNSVLSNPSTTAALCPFIEG